MKDSFPKQIFGLREAETPQESDEKKLTLDEIESGLKYAEDTGRLLEKAYWEDAQGQHDQIQIFDLLTLSEKKGGLYDYFEHLRGKHGENIITMLNNNIEKANDRIQRSGLFWKINEQVFVEEYNKLVRDGINSAFNLRLKGDYTTEEVIAILIKEPLSKWPKVTKRLLEIKKAKQLVHN